jgi:two-component system, NarL family, sensor kinase
MHSILQIQTGTEAISYVVFSTIFMALMLIMLFLTVLFFQKRMLAKQQEITRQELEHQKHLRQLEIDIVNTERPKLYRDLHDGLSLHLYALRQYVEKYNNKLQQASSPPFEIEPYLTLVEDAHTTLRGITYNVLPASIQEAGLFAALKNYVNHVNQVHNTRITCNFPDELLPMNLSNQMHLFKIIQELLNNTIKYAHASSIELAAELGKRNYISITHNGDGVSNQEIEQIRNEKQTAGLKNVEHRSYLINASIDYIKQKPQSSVVVNLNLEN